MEITLRELLYDEDFIAKIYGWCYNHTFERTFTEELCQEVILQLLIVSQTVTYKIIHMRTYGKSPKIRTTA